MSLEERHLAAIALGACLFLPYYIEIPKDRDAYLLLLLYGGPVPVWSPLASVVAAIFLVVHPRRAFGAAIQWLAAWLAGLFLVLYGGAVGYVSWWPWAAAPLVGAWVVSVALRAPRQEEQRTDVSVFD